MTTRVEASCRGRVVIVRKVGAGHEERVAPFEDRAEGLAERQSRLGGLPPHDERHDPRLRGDALQKRQLHFERMLAAVRGSALVHDRRGRHDGRRTLLIDIGDAERRFKTSGSIDGHAFEPEEVRGPNEHDQADSTVEQLAIGVRRHRTRIHQSRMRRNQGDELCQSSGRLPADARQVAVDGRRKRGRRARIPGARDSRLCG